MKPKPHHYFVTPLIKPPEMEIVAASDEQAIMIVRSMPKWNGLEYDEFIIRRDDQDIGVHLTMKGT